MGPTINEQITLPTKLVEGIYQFLTQLPLPMAQAQVAIGLVQAIQVAGEAHNLARAKAKEEEAAPDAAPHGPI